MTNKMIRNIAFFFTCALIVGFTSSCSDKDDDSKNPLAGTTWYDAGRAYTVNTGNAQYNKIIADELYLSELKTSTITFNSDGTITTKYDGTGTYSIDGNAVLINEISFRLNGNVLSTEDDRTEEVQNLINAEHFPGVPATTVVINAIRTSYLKKL